MGNAPGANRVRSGLPTTVAGRVGRQLQSQSDCDRNRRGHHIQARLADAPGNVACGGRGTGLAKPSVVNVSQVITVDKSLLELSGRVACRPNRSLSGSRAAAQPRAYREAGQAVVGRLETVGKQAATLLPPAYSLQPTSLLLFPITCFELVTNGENQDNVIGWKPTILCDVPVAAARKHEFTPPFLGFAPQQRVVRQEFKRLAHAQKLLASPLRILRRDEIEEPLEICERPLGYFDARHARARGRRPFLPEIRVSRYSKVVGRSKARPLASASFSDCSASAANRSRSSDRSASRARASTMNACGVFRAEAASRSMRRLSSSGSFKLVAAMEAQRVRVCR